MGKTVKMAAAIAAAGIVAAGASAFTASSTIDNANKYVGATSQTISGVHVSNVSYTWDSTGSDGTTGVNFHTAEVLGPNDTMTVKLNGTTADSCDKTIISGTSTDWVCTWDTVVVNATSLSIVVN